MTFYIKLPASEVYLERVCQCSHDRLLYFLRQKSLENDNNISGSSSEILISNEPSTSSGIKIPDVPSMLSETVVLDGPCTSFGPNKTNICNAADTSSKTDLPTKRKLLCAMGVSPETDMSNASSATSKRKILSALGISSEMSNPPSHSSQTKILKTSSTPYKKRMLSALGISCEINALSTVSKTEIPKLQSTMSKTKSSEIRIPNASSTSIKTEIPNTRNILSLKELPKAAKCTSSETMIPNTLFDHVGHFVLKCFTLREPCFEQFIRQSETELYIHRLNNSTVNEVMKYSARAIREVETMLVCDMIPDFGEDLYSAIVKISNKLMQLDIARHFVKQCNNECTLNEIELPFQMCLSLLPKREVILRSGVATVYCGKWRKLLEELFDRHYDLMRTTLPLLGVVDRMRHDDRFMVIFSHLKEMFKNDANTNDKFYGKKLLAKRIDSESVFFPPCMNHLLKDLRKNHRLSHDSRYYFSLFLKDIGMSFEEAMHFWKDEYMKPASSCANCTHSWQNQEKKYTYSIRHLYGMAGVRRIRTAKDCSQMQSTSLSMRDEHGCPFVHFDEKNLLKCLSPKVLKDEKIKSNILDLTKSKKPSQACQLYMSHFMKTNDDVSIHAAVEYKAPTECYFKCKAMACDDLF